jgi:hypothetical protein
VSIALICAYGIVAAGGQDQSNTGLPASPDAGGTKNQAGPAPQDSHAVETETRQRRTQLNLVGAVDTNAGESRRNENVYFNPIDNNALKELNVRLGTTATIVERFVVDRNYFGAEFGNSPSTTIHEGPTVASKLHGQVFWIHDNSVFRARSFFQAGDVKPARENNYGFAFTTPLWESAFFIAEGAQQKVRGIVNGNVLVPKADERIPLTNDPQLRPIVQRFLAAYPSELPNRTDINPRALNTNAPQHIDTDSLKARLEQQWRAQDVFRFGYMLTSQKVDAFQFVAGQNPDTRTLAHSARFTWARAWSPSRTTDVSAGFDRVYSALVPEPNSVGLLSLSAPQLNRWVQARISQSTGHRISFNMQGRHAWLRDSIDGPWASILYEGRSTEARSAATGVCSPFGMISAVTRSPISYSGFRAVFRVRLAMCTRAFAIWRRTCT